MLLSLKTMKLDRILTLDAVRQSPLLYAWPSCDAAIRKINRLDLFWICAVFVTRNFQLSAPILKYSPNRSIQEFGEIIIRDLASRNATMAVLPSLKLIRHIASGNLTLLRISLSW